VPTFGDGSGTGTGGTIQYALDEPLQMWKAVWTTEARAHLSNWKEAETLRLTLERAKTSERAGICGCTLFYFTDNIVTYYAVTKGASCMPSLHAIVAACKEQEVELGCQLEPVHVPGTTIILQTTDRLSRGIWGSALHQRVSQRAILAEIFAPVPMCPTIGGWACRMAGVPAYIPRFYQRWETQWSYNAVADHLIVWAPPPEIAAQLLHFRLMVYVEAPLTTAAVILIPHILQRRWTGMSNVVIEVGSYQRTDVPVLCHTNLTIPIVILLIPYHVRRLSSVHRMDSPSTIADQRTHAAAKTHLYGMLEAPDSR
jgi:hypothetical protein